MTTSNLGTPGDWYGIDFHVHSPASRCFASHALGKEDGDDALYFWLLEQAKLAEVDVIVITDHNDVSGYEKLIELKTDLTSTKRTLARAGVPIPDNVQRQIDLFDGLCILPGAELDVDPNLHFLVLFNPLLPVDEISEFLNRGGFPEDVRGSESAARHAAWNVNEVCSEAAQLDAIVIAAHVDSDKGLYEASKKWGQKRIASFTDDNLMGMEFINPKSRDQIESILSQPAYARQTKLAFIQSSDFHGREGEQIGGRRTYVRLDGVQLEPSLVFQALKKALRNPDEYVSAPGRPEIREIQQRLTHSPHIESLDAEPDITKLHRYVCAFGNSGDGTIVIGRNETGNWTGIQCDDHDKLASRIVDLVRSGANPMSSIEIVIYPYYGDKAFATVRVRKQPRLCSTGKDGRVYLLVGDTLEQASISQIVQLVEDRLLKRYAYLSITDRIAKISKRLGGTKDSLDVLPVLRKIEAKTVPFQNVFPPPQKGALKIAEWEDSIDFDQNGFPDGNVIVLQPIRPRLSDQYIRLTAPLGKCDPRNPKFEESKHFSGDKIVIAPLGAVYFDPGSEVIVLGEECEPLVCQPYDEYAELEMKFVAAYLKSAVTLWHADRCLGSTDLHNVHQVLPRIPIPDAPPPDCVALVLDLADQLVSLEQAFLATERRLLALQADAEDDPDESLVEEYSRSVLNHNEAAAKLMAKLDGAFFDLFELTEAEVALVQQGIESADLEVFKLS